MLLVLIVGLSEYTEEAEAKAKGEEYLNILALCIYFIWGKKKNEHHRQLFISENSKILTECPSSKELAI